MNMFMNWKNRLFEKPFVGIFFTCIIRVLMVIEYLFLCSVIGISIVCLVHILMGEPFSLHILWNKLFDLHISFSLS